MIQLSGRQLGTDTQGEDSSFIRWEELGGRFTVSISIAHTRTGSPSFQVLRKANGRTNNILSVSRNSESITSAYDQRLVSITLLDRYSIGIESTTYHIPGSLRDGIGAQKLRRLSGSLKEVDFPDS